jgi:hypothetical protein
VVFSAATIYLVAAMLATVYNFNLLLRNPTTAYSWRLFQWNVFIIAICLVIFPIGIWMSIEGMLSSSIEILFIVCFFVCNILWTYFFYHGWSKLIREGA